MNTRALASVALLSVLSLGFGSPTAAATKPKCTPVPVDLGLTASAPGGTGLNDFPVFVHYMINDGWPADDPSMPLPPPVPTGSASYPPSLVADYFAPTGLFNQLWSLQGITFILVGVETCKYNVKSLDPNFTNRERFPNPAKNVNLALTVFKRYNAKSYNVGTAIRPFKGLDLYIFWSLDGPAGYGVSPKFKTLASGGQVIQTPGGAFLDGDCQDPATDPPGPPGDGCRREFAHEVGHFFSLCHCCSTDLVSAPQTATCTTAYCPDVVTAGTTVPACDSSTSFANRLMATNWANDALTPCEIVRATNTALQILQ